MEELLGAHGLVCEPLDEDHWLMDFETGRDERLDRWLNDKAHRYQTEDLCRVSILRKEGTPQTIVGYFALAAHSVESEDVARGDRVVDQVNGGMVGAMRAYPASLLGKFALDKEFQGGQMGALMMSCVYEQHLETAERSGVKFLVTEAQNKNLVDYYSGRYGFVAASNGVAGKTPLYKATSGIRLEMNAIRKRI